MLLAASLRPGVQPEKTTMSLDYASCDDVIIELLQRRRLPRRVDDHSYGHDL
jgi:hypothetical protein